MISLCGIWNFELDRNNIGVDERWYDRPLESTIRLPGSLQEQGFGDDITVDTQWTGEIIDKSWFTADKYAPYRLEGNIKIPFWLQPEKHYVGPAWYQRPVTIPDDWVGRRIVLKLERPHIKSTVWLNDREVGSSDSLSTPHAYDLGFVEPGEHSLTIRIDNRPPVDVGPNSHSITDHTQSNWNGIVGLITLTSTGSVWISRVNAVPDISHRTFLTKVELSRLAEDTNKCLVTAECGGEDIQQEVLWDGLTGTAMLLVELREGSSLWDEFQPETYALTVRVDVDTVLSDEKTITVGLCQPSVSGTQIAINGRKTFMRGTLECCVFPLTGYPPTDIASWSRIFSTCQSHGLNHVRFHSWCPPEAAFEAADRAGIYLQIECGSWANTTTALGEGRPIDAWLYEEADRILEAYGNHPSFVMMAYGNEPAGNMVEYLEAWVRHYKSKDPRRLYTSAAGWPAIEASDYHNVPEPRIQSWGEELNSRINACAPETLTDYSGYVSGTSKPTVSHEIGQWCVYPDFTEISRYTGVLKAKNFEIFRDSLMAGPMHDQSSAFLTASGKLQILCYKEEIESALRTPGFGGIQLLQANDFPGQGTALVGWLDPFWNAKGYVTDAEFRRFCNAVTVLARLERRYYRQSDRLDVPLDIANYGPRDISAGLASWSLVESDGTEVASGVVEAPVASQGCVTRVGTVTTALLTCRAPSALKLIASFGGYSNDWDLWVMPDQVESINLEAVEVVSDVEDAINIAVDGGAVVLMADTQRVKVDSTVGFSSIFWNTAWTRNQAPHTLGLVCDAGHPVFAEFPTECHSDWQWWELVSGASAMTVDVFPNSFRPLVQPIDTWFENRRLALLFEAALGSGRIIVCSMDLTSRLNERIIARQFRHSLLKYASSNAFDPDVAVTADLLRGLFVT